ncbi:MAG: hypothetical protein HYZ69_00055 [Candidatus Colwellbacteria bacterium]|nr:hypothetical protein [Candidatus Colwellbacteria bacterium]
MNFSRGLSTFGKSLIFIFSPIKPCFWAIRYLPCPSVALAKERDGSFFVIAKNLHIFIVNVRSSVGLFFVARAYNLRGPSSRSVLVDLLLLKVLPEGQVLTLNEVKRKVLAEGEVLIDPLFYHTSLQRFNRATRGAGD